MNKQRIQKALTAVVMVVCLLISFGRVKEEIILKAASTPVFKEVSVHDPSIMKANGTYYIIGSHMASAKSTDLMNWTQMSYSASDTTLFNNVGTELSEALTWGQSDTFWAGDWIQLEDGKYYMYYCVCRGDCPQSCIGYAVADNPEGPYTNKGLLLKSSGTTPFSFQNADGSTVNYDSNIHPNAVDPNVFFDKEGKLWMVYGSYSGGIYILELDPATGAVKAGQDYYGTKLTGGYHSRIEAPYIMYSEQTGYYYLFLSFGGLSSDGGYNVRVSRSTSPDGPYYDSQGNNMLNCKGIPGQFLEAQDSVINAYGTEIMGNHMFARTTGETAGTTGGYVSPGHNSAYYDSVSGKYYLIFHSRFPGMGEGHAVRVHQMFMNESNWPVVAAHRYGGETIGTVTNLDIVGTYKYMDIGRTISSNIPTSKIVQLNEDGTITGDANGTWSLSSNNQATIKIGNYTFYGVFLNQFDTNISQNTMTFSVVGNSTGKTLLGSKVVYDSNSGTATVIQSNKTIGATSLLSDVPYVITNVFSGLRMELADASTAVDTNIQQWEKIAGTHQEWRIVDLGTGYCKIVSMSNESMAVTVDGNNAADGTNIKLAPYNGNNTQQFKLAKNADGSYAILTKSSNDTSGLDVFNWSNENGGNINQWNYWGGDCQNWTIEPAKSQITEGTYYIRNVNSGKMLDVENGLNVQQWTANALAPQQWKLVGVGSGYYKLVSMISDGSKVIDIVGKNAADGNNVVIYDYNGGTNQQFSILVNDDGSYRILSRCSGGASGIDVFNISTENGANINQWNYWGGAGQNWVFVPVE